MHDKFALRHPSTLIYEEVHDRLGNKIGDVLLNDREVAEDEVLDDTSLHHNTGTLLLGVGSER